MKGLGSGDNGEFTFLDTLSIISFLIAIENLGLNISQEDIQKQTKELDAKVDERVDKALNEIHNHLTKQDKKIDLLLERVNNNEND